MFRKLTIILCLISFAPAAVNAQALAAVTAPQAAVASATEKAMSAGQEIHMSLPAESSAAVLLAATEAPQVAAMATAPGQKREARHAHSWDNFVDVHFGDYRWVWWAGAAAILIGIHVVAAGD